VLLFTLAYVVSPFDLLPDWEPLIGVLDDATLITLGIALATRLIPREIMAEHRAVASRHLAKGARLGWGCLIVAILWLMMLAALVFVVVKLK
jgi:uncharacterized membrane protein YkvA (DUF1232 family)